MTLLDLFHKRHEMVSYIQHCQSAIRAGTQHWRSLEVQIRILGVRIALINQYIRRAHHAELRASS